MSIKNNLGFKVLAFVAAASLAVMALFCVFIVLLMHACSTAAEEGIREGNQHAERQIKQIEKAQDEIHSKFERLRPFDTLQPPPSSPTKNYY